MDQYLADKYAHNFFANVTCTCTTTAGNQRRFCDAISSDLHATGEMKMAVDDAATNYGVFAGGNSVVKSTVAAESVKPETFGDEFLSLSTKLQSDDEVEVG